MPNQNNKTEKQKQYTTLRILSATHQKIKLLADCEQRNIDVVGNRLLDQALQLPFNLEKLSQVQ